jgi:hypothetical protein
MTESRLCTFPGCGNRHKANGYCTAHNHRFKRYGDPSISKRNTPGTASAYLRDVVTPYQGNECIIWPFYRMPDGRAELTIGGKTRMVARYVCEQVNGRPPTPDHQAAHSCGKGNDGCVTPKHLSWKTRSENEMDKFEHGTRVRGSAHSWSKLTEDDVIKIRQMAGALSQGRIAKMFGLRQSTVSQIISRQRWSHLP